MLMPALAMLDKAWCELCQSYQLGPCRSPDDAAQCPMWNPDALYQAVYLTAFRERSSLTGNNEIPRSLRADTKPLGELSNLC